MSIVSQINLLQDNGGTPGGALSSTQLVSGTTFWVEIQLQDLRINSSGIVGSRLNLSWNSNSLTATSLTVTNSLPLLRSENITTGNAQVGGGSIPTAGIGKAIGKDKLERFALVKLTTKFDLDANTALFTIAANPIHFATADGITVLNGSPLIALVNPITTIPENTSTSTAVKVANLSITDDIFGNNTTSLSGSDASSFEIKGNELYLKAGTNLNYNTKSSYSVILSVNDANINKGDSKTFNLSVTPVTLPTLSIEATNAIQSEGNLGTKSFNFIVIRSGDISNVSSANWTVTGFGINQANNTDFVAGTLPTGTVSFAAGETSQTITVNVSGDTSVELDEEFIVTLSTPTNATVTTGTARGTITNDDNNQPKVISGTDQGDIIDATTRQSTVMPGKGDDIIIVNTASVVIIELPNEGNDTVFSSVNYNLAALPQIENLTLTGTTDINGIGNGKDNVITGNSGQNVLTGLQGNDTFVFNFGDSVVGKPDKIRDFQFGKDKIRVNGLSPSVLTRATNSTASTLDSLVNSVFIDANGAESGNQAFATNSAALVVSTAQGIGGTYLIVNDGIGGFNPATDLVINLTGYSSTLPRVGNIGVSNLSLFV